MITVQFYDDQSPPAVYAQVQEPPARFDRMPSGRVVVFEDTVQAVRERCRDLGAGDDAAACARPLPFGDCVVVLPKVGVGGVGAATQVALLRHEHGHCNGWPKDHPK
jgi:hypothetical protein